MSQETQMLNTIFQDLEFNRECDISTGNRFLAKKGLLPEKYSQLKKANVRPGKKASIKSCRCLCWCLCCFHENVISIHFYKIWQCILGDKGKHESQGMPDDIFENSNKFRCMYFDIILSLKNKLRETSI